MWRQGTGTRTQTVVCVGMPNMVAGCPALYYDLSLAFSDCGLLQVTTSRRRDNALCVGQRASNGGVWLSEQWIMGNCTFQFFSALCFTYTSNATSLSIRLCYTRSPDANRRVCPGEKAPGERIVSMTCDFLRSNSLCGR